MMKKKSNRLTRAKFDAMERELNMKTNEVSARGNTIQDLQDTIGQLKIQRDTALGQRGVAEDVTNQTKSQLHRTGEVLGAGLPQHSHTKNNYFKVEARATNGERLLVPDLNDESRKQTFVVDEKWRRVPNKIMGTQFMLPIRVPGLAVLIGYDLLDYTVAQALRYAFQSYVDQGSPQAGNFLETRLVEVEVSTMTQMREVGVSDKQDSRTVPVAEDRFPAIK